MKALTNQELQEIVDEIPIVVLHNIGTCITNLRNENWKLTKNYKRNRTINEKLKKRINKAIKYLEENEFEDVYGYTTDWQNLMKILKGEDNDK